MELLYIGFNSLGDRITCGTQKGFIVYRVDKCTESFRRNLDHAVSIVEQYGRSNILAVVLKTSSQKLMIWDDYQAKSIASLEYPMDIQSVKFRTNHIYIILDTKISIYNFKDLTAVNSINTGPNLSGICEITSDEKVLACPGLKPGLLNIANGQIIPAHVSGLSRIALNTDGTLVASSSERGTLIRVFNIADGNKIAEFRRGMGETQIYTLLFSPKSEFLLVGSQTGTIHIYKIVLSASARSTHSLFYHPDFAHISIPYTPFKCCFTGDKSILVVCNNGSWFKYDLNSNGELILNQKSVLPN